MTFGLACDRDGYDLRQPQCSQCGSRGCPNMNACRSGGQEPDLIASYRDIFAEITAKATPVCDPSSDDPERVRYYRIPVGPIHRAAGKLGFQMFNGEQHLADTLKEIERLRAALSSTVRAPIEIVEGSQS